VVEIFNPCIESDRYIMPMYMYMYVYLAGIGKRPRGICRFLDKDLHWRRHDSRALDSAAGHCIGRRPPASHVTYQLSRPAMHGVTMTASSAGVICGHPPTPLRNPITRTP